MTDHPTAVRVTDLAVHLTGGPELLAPTTLTLRRGRVSALTGPSGSGKTTLLRAVIGDLPGGARVASGTVDVLGHDVFTLPAGRLRDLRRHRVAYVGQDPGSALNPRMRVRHLVAETAVDPSLRAVLGLLAECRLPTGTGLPDRRPGALSGGQQRRVALARALAREPEVLLLDEPTAGLDTALRDEIADLLCRLATTRKLAVVLACHDPELVERCADDVIDLGTARAPAAPLAVPAPKARPADPRGSASGAGCVRSHEGAPPLYQAHSGDFDNAANVRAGRREPTKIRLTGPVRPRPERPAADAAAPGSGLAAHGIEVGFTQGGRTHRALAGVDFAAAPGAAAGIVGPSGSGKTTLLRVLAGLQRPAAGTLTLDGRPLPATARARDRDRQRRIQLVPQNPLGALNPTRTIGATLARPLRLHRTTPGPDIAGRVTGLLHDVGLPADFAGRYPHELSGGQRQRASIARALAPDPDILLCDEVTSALDADTATAVMELLTRLRDGRGLTLVLVSHELPLVAACTDTLHLLEEGRVTATGPTAELLPATG